MYKNKNKKVFATSTCTCTCTKPSRSWPLVVQTDQARILGAVSPEARFCAARSQPLNARGKWIASPERASVLSSSEFEMCAANSQV